MIGELVQGLMHLHMSEPAVALRDLSVSSFEGLILLIAFQHC